MQYISIYGVYINIRRICSTYQYTPYISTFAVDECVCCRICIDAYAISGMRVKRDLEIDLLRSKRDLLTLASAVCVVMRHVRWREICVLCVCGWAAVFC